QPLDYTAYLSPYTWRYATSEMRAIWSEINKREIWRRLWIALAKVQAEFGLVTEAQIADLHAHAKDIDVARAHEIEAEIHRDVMAEVKTFAEQCPVGGGIIHLGMTSMDIVDNTDALRVRQSLDLVLEHLAPLLTTFCDLIDRWADTPIMAFTHLQPAEPSTLGYRLAQYAQDLLADWENLTRLRANLKGKGLKGAVGTSASYAELLGADNLPRFEARLSEILALPFFPVATQTYPRKQDYDVICALAGLGASLYKFAFDLRLLQSPPIGELAEPFGKKQIGSSAMPFKRNPINAEKMNSLARLLAQFPRVAWDNAAHSLLERTLDDSANRRTTLAEAFLIADELLITSYRITKNLQVNKTAINRNLAIYGPFAATERVLMALGKAGADRQQMHARLQKHALAAWAALQRGDPNPLAGLITADPEMLAYLPEDELRALMEAAGHTGDAPMRAHILVEQIRNNKGNFRTFLHQLRKATPEK
ncbi:MAG: adenylosuccinate lyase, partial [Anaerolineales bacterium]